MNIPFLRLFFTKRRVFADPVPVWTWLSFLGFSAVAYSQVASQEALSITTNGNEVTLTWPGGEPLLSSSDLIEWVEVVGATSPFIRNTTSREQEFYSLAFLETNVLIPEANATVGTQLVPVRGVVGSALRGTDGLTVQVSGQTAQIVQEGNGAETFVLDDFPLSLGLNTLTVTASNTAGLTETSTLQVTYDPILANNVVIRGNHAYAAEGINGLVIIDLTTRTRTQLQPVIRVDDLSIDGDLLFTLDGDDGSLSVFSLAQDPVQPSLTSGPVSVPVFPFSGVSAAAGRVIVSGGTSLLTVRTYNGAGSLGSQVSSIDLGIGQPDVLISPDGTRGFVSTDFSGTVNGAGFGITIINLSTPPTAPTIASRTGILGAGFSAGFLVPANFPIESAQIGSTLLVAHGGGLALLSADSGAFQRGVSLGFSATNVDAVGTRAFVVGVQGLNSNLAEIDLSNPNSPAVVQTQLFPNADLFTGVAANEDFVVIAANTSGLLVRAR